MIDLGWFELFPELGNRSEWDSWANRVVKPCQALAPPFPTTHSEVRRAFTIAQGCLGDCWVVPFAASLFALKSRKQDNTKIVEAFSAMFEARHTYLYLKHIIIVPAEIAELSLLSIKADCDGLPEVIRFANLAGSIYGVSVMEILMYC